MNCHTTKSDHNVVGQQNERGMRNCNPLCIHTHCALAHSCPNGRGADRRCTTREVSNADHRPQPPNHKHLTPAQLHAPTLTLTCTVKKGDGQQKFLFHMRLAIRQTQHLRSASGGGEREGEGVGLVQHDSTPASVGPNWFLKGPKDKA